VDREGAIYVTGSTVSKDFPTLKPFQESYGGGWEDVFIAKVNASGSALIYSTYLGGSNHESGNDIAVDSKGVAYVTGYTYSDDFPTHNPFQGSLAGNEGDVLIAKIETAEGIRIVSWNMLNYPDANEEPREEYYSRILEYLSPDILVVQEMASYAGVDQFLEDVLKPISKKYRAAKFFDGPDTDNALFYDKSQFKLRSSLQIPTSFRDISEYELKMKKGPGKGGTFKIYSVHFTEGLSSGDKSQRENEANILRAYLDGLPLDDLFLVCGTFNMTGSNEKAYVALTCNQFIEPVRLIDPITKSGRWHNMRKFRNIHTESTRKIAYGDGASGGLDDRYDMILVSAALDGNGALKYWPGSFFVCGNDGKHFNKAINHPTNKSVSFEIAEALYMGSDHLPVVIDLVPQDRSK
jgi:endonuclease/exonuclease/phosphatase family metal-dependent hydrolase